MIIVNSKDSLIQSLKNSAQFDKEKSPFVDNVTELLAPNSYYYDENKQALKINNNTSAKGALSIKLGYLVKGTKTKVKCEIYAFSGVLPKICIDYNTYPQCHRDYHIGTSEIYQMDEQGSFKTIEVEFTNKYSGFGKVVIGNFTSDEGTFYIRNIKIENEGSNIKRSLRAYNINQNTVQGNFGYDEADISVNESEKYIKITHKRPFSVNKRGIAIANKNGGSTQKNIEPRTRTEQVDSVIVEFYDTTTNTLVAPSTLSQYYWFSVIHYGFDYEGNDF